MELKKMVREREGERRGRGKEGEEEEMRSLREERTMVEQVRG
jgi:hypothetical protein